MSQGLLRLDVMPQLMLVGGGGLCSSGPLMDPTMMAAVMGGEMGWE